MSNFGGPNSSYEKHFRKKFSELNAKLEVLENKLQKLLFSSLAKTKTNAAYWSALNREISSIYFSMEKIAESWFKDSLPIAYRASVRNIFGRISTTKSILNVAEKGLTEYLKSNASRQLVTSLYLRASEDFKNALLAGKSNVLRFTRKTQQLLINESILDLTVARGFEQGNLNKAIGSLVDTFYTKMLGSIDSKHFIQAGSKKFTVSYYSEMVARVKWHEAQRDAALSQAQNFDTDLIQVSTHNTTTPICQQYEGKIFSINGRDKRFPPLTEVTPYHVNCLHLLFPVFESSLIVQGTLKDFSSFSLGLTAKPPFPKGYVPIKERKK